MKKLFLGSALAVAIAAPAMAADMAVRYVPPVPVYTWSGCYVGGQVGYGWGYSRHTAAGATNGVPNGITGDVAPRYGVNGAVGGGEVGCNWQWTPNWVVGIELDGSWTAKEGQATNFGGLVLTPTLSSLWVSKTSERWLATARGRLGYAWDKWLWYITAGGAWAGVDINTSSVNAGLPPAFQQIEQQHRTGWVVGWGTEYALNWGWIVSFETLYVDLGNKRAFDTVNNSPAIPGVGGCFNVAVPVSVANCTNRDVRLYEWISRFDLKYKFDWATWGKGKAPAVVTKG